MIQKLTPTFVKGALRRVRGIPHRIGRLLLKTGSYLAPARMEDAPKYQYELHVVNRDRLSGKVAIITGGGGSIGSALAYRLAIEGAHVGIVGRTQHTLDAAAAQIIAAGVHASQISTVILDVTKEDQVRDGITRFAQLHGRLDILINNAGQSSRGQIRALDAQDMSVVEATIGLNLLGPIQCAKYAIPFLKQVQGRIINLGSVVGIAGQKHYSEYSAAKSALLGLTKSLALELGSDGVTVNMVTPGFVWRNSFDGAQKRPTEKTAIGRYGTPEEVAGLVAYLCSEEAGYVTGVEIPVDGGRSLGLRGET